MTTQADRYPLPWHIIAACALAFVLSAALRLSEAAHWVPSAHQLDGEYLLATHDAYAWAAGAEHEQARTSRHPMARLLAAATWISSVSAANAAYWLPAFLGALTAIPITLWAFHLGASAMIALAAGVFGSIAPAFFARTRLGYFDSDWATMFFPLMISWPLAVWGTHYVSAYARDPGSEPGDPRAFPWLALLLVMLPVGIVWHDFIPTYALAAVWISLPLLFLFGKRPLAGDACVDLLAISLALAAGWLGAMFGSVLLFIRSRWSKRSIRSRTATFVSLGLLLAVLTLLSASQFEDYLGGKIVQYFQPTVAETPGLVFPDLGQSVREVQSVDLPRALGGAAFTWWLGGIGLVGISLAAFKDPTTLYLAPLLALGLLSPRIGARFTMYAAPGLVLGVCLLIENLTGRLLVGKRSMRRWWFTAVFTGLLLLVYRSYLRFPIETVLSREHAAGLKRLSSTASPDAMVWTWWDYGYAAQYYTGLSTFADGGRNGGETLFTLGYVLASTDQGNAAGMMRFTASHAFQPWQTWNGFSPDAFALWLDHAGFREDLSPSQMEQYLAVQWDAIALLEWIQAYGAWDFATQTSGARQPVYHLQPLELDLEAGIFKERSGNTFELETADILTPTGTNHYEFAHHDTSLHLLLHSEKAEAFLLGEALYRSTLVQLLLGNASDEFELAVNRSPDLAIYRLK